MRFVSSETEPKSTCASTSPPPWPPVLTISAICGLSAGSRQDVREALLETQERCFEPAIRHRSHGDGSCQRNPYTQRISEEVCSLIVDGVVRNQQAQHMEYVKPVGNATQINQHSVASTGMGL